MNHLTFSSNMGHQNCSLRLERDEMIALLPTASCTWEMREKCFPLSVTTLWWPWTSQCMSFPSIKKNFEAYQTRLCTLDSEISVGESQLSRIAQTTSRQSSAHCGTA